MCVLCITYLITVEMFSEERIGTDTDVDCSQAHVDTEEEEVTVVVMAHAIVEPGWVNG